MRGTVDIGIGTTSTSTQLLTRARSGDVPGPLKQQLQGYVEEQLQRLAKRPLSPYLALSLALVEVR